MFSQDIGIDLGTKTILIYVKDKGIVLREPSMIAVDKETGEVIAVGYEAKRMVGKTPKNIEIVQPLAKGVISDYKLTEKLLKAYIKKINQRRFFPPKVMVCIPAQVTEVERKALIDVLSSLGVKKIFLLEEPIAAALGAGLDISKPQGNVIIDIGGGTTDMAVISYDATVKSKSVKIAGDTFDKAIKRYIKKKYNVKISMQQAEDLKIAIGNVYSKYNEKESEIIGKDVLTGIPKTLTVKTSDIYEALRPYVIEIIEEFKELLEETPPELITDIIEKGIYITGGGSLIEGLDKLFKEMTGINAIIAEDAISCVAIGTGIALKKMDIEEVK